MPRSVIVLHLIGAAAGAVALTAFVVALVQGLRAERRGDPIHPTGAP
jgi:hypothetical protein